MPAPFFFFFNLNLYPMDLIITILPVVTKDLPISPRFTPYDFLSRCKVSTLTTRQPMVEFYLLKFPRFPLRKKEHKFYFGNNRTHDFRTSRCAGYLLDHSGDTLSMRCIVPPPPHTFVIPFVVIPLDYTGVILASAMQMPPPKLTDRHTTIRPQSS